MDNTVFLVTKRGLNILVGHDGDEVRQKIAEKENHLDFQRYDDDKHAWAYWAVQKNGSGDNADYEPFQFPVPDDYGMTSGELFSKVVTYPTILAQVITIITRKAPTAWEKMMKPATIIMAIVLIIFIMVVAVVALGGA